MDSAQIKSLHEQLDSLVSLLYHIPEPWHIYSVEHILLVYDSSNGRNVSTLSHLTRYLEYSQYTEISLDTY